MHSDMHASDTAPILNIHPLQGYETREARLMGCKERGCCDRLVLGGGQDSVERDRVNDCAFGLPAHNTHTLCILVALAMAG